MSVTPGVSRSPLSRRYAYAIRALVYLTMQPPGRLCGAEEISGQEDIPASFLSKVLLQLQRRRLVRSYEGVGGGYELALPPGKLSLMRILRCIDEDTEIPHGYSLRAQCLPHEPWSKLGGPVLNFLESTTLAALVRLSQAELAETAAHSRLGNNGKLLD